MQIHVHHGQANIKSNHVGQGQRTDGLVAPQLHARIDVFSGGHALSQHKEGFVDHGHQDAIHHKAGCVFHGDGAFAQAGRQVVHRSMRGIGRLQATDDFDQSHHGHRVEKVHANEAVGTGRDRCQLGDGNGRGVGRDDDFGGQHAVELLDDLDLEVEVLCGGFDDELRDFEVVIARAGFDA